MVAPWLCPPTTRPAAMTCCCSMPMARTPVRSHGAEAASSRSGARTVGRSRYRPRSTTSPIGSMSWRPTAPTCDRSVSLGTQTMSTPRGLRTAAASSSHRARAQDKRSTAWMWLDGPSLTRSPTTAEPAQHRHHGACVHADALRARPLNLALADHEVEVAALVRRQDALLETRPCSALQGFSNVAVYRTDPGIYAPGCCQFL